MYFKPCEILWRDVMFISLFESNDLRFGISYKTHYKSINSSLFFFLICFDMYKTVFKALSLCFYWYVKNQPEGILIRTWWCFHTNYSFNGKFVYEKNIWEIFEFSAILTYLPWRGARHFISTDVMSITQ